MSAILIRAGVCVVALAFTLSTMPVALELDLGATSASAQRRGGGPAARPAPNRAAPAQRAGGGGRPDVRSNARTSINNSGARNNNVNANRNVNRNNVNVNNTNVNVNRNVNVNVDNHGGYGWGNDWDDHWHPVATAAAVTATAIVVGSIVRSIPPNCTTVIVNGISYSQCGSTWYAPQYSGSSVQYVVVAPPR